MRYIEAAYCIDRRDQRGYIRAMKGDPRGVFYDINSDPEVAADLTARSRLMMAITERIRAEGWTQVQAADVLHVNQPRVSDLLNGKIHKFSLDDLVRMVEQLGSARPTTDETQRAEIRDMARYVADASQELLKRLE